MLKAFLINVLGGIFYGTADFYQREHFILGYSILQKIQPLIWKK